MNETEVSNMLNLLYVTYPHSFMNWKANQFQSYKAVWLGCFNKIPAKFVNDAVISYISTNTSDYAPKPGQIRAIIMSQLAPETELEAITAWEKLKRYIRRRTGESSIDRPEYNKLDDITQRIYSFDDMRTIAQMDSDKLEYRRSEFQRLYKVLKDKQNEKYLSEGDLVGLAGGEEAYTALGYKASPQESNRKELTENT